MYRSIVESAKRGRLMHLGPRLSRRIFNRMKQLIEVVAFVGCLALIDCALVAACAQTAPHSKAGPPYLGFDRNDYPGDTTLPTLRKTFSYTSYWLNNPPGEIANSWAGKRAILRENGFGFLVLFTGRTDAQIKVAASIGESAGQLGALDGKAAVAGAVSEGFPKERTDLSRSGRGRAVVAGAGRVSFRVGGCSAGRRREAGRLLLGDRCPRGNWNHQHGAGHCGEAKHSRRCKKPARRKNHGAPHRAVDRERPMPPCARMLADGSATRCGSSGKPSALCNRLAVRAIAAPGAVQHQLPAESSAGWELLFAGRQEDSC